MAFYSSFWPSFGFNSIAAMLTEASEVMEQQAESNRELRRKLDKAEQLAATRNEDIGRLQGELKQATARIAELEAAQQWQPISNQRVIDKLDGNIYLDVGFDGASFEANWPDDYNDEGEYDFVTIDLPDDCAICRKIQPAA